MRSKLSLILLHLLFCFFIGSNSYGQNKIIIPDTSQFLFDLDIKYVGKSTRIDPNYQYVLEHLVEVLEAYPFLKVEIRGHVCCGPAKKLSTKRAKRVYKELLLLGIDENRMTYDGYSDEVPLAFPEKTDEDKLRNRRVDFILRR